MAGKTAKQMGMTRAQAKAHRRGRGGGKRRNPSLRSASALFVNPGKHGNPARMPKGWTYDYEQRLYVNADGWGMEKTRPGVWYLYSPNGVKVGKTTYKTPYKAAADADKVNHYHDGERVRREARSNPSLPKTGTFYLRTENSGGDKRTSRAIAERVVKAPMNCTPGPGGALLLLHVAPGYKASDVRFGHGTILWEYCGVRVGRER